MRNGTLSRELVWATPSGKHVRVRSTRLVSFEHRHVIAMSYEVVVDRHAPVVIRSRVVNRSDAERRGSRTSRSSGDDPRGSRRGSATGSSRGRLVEDEGNRLVLGYQTVQSGMTLAIAVDHVVEVNSTHQLSSVADADASEFIVAVDAEPDIADPGHEVRDVSDVTQRRARPSSLIVAGGPSVG